MMLSEESIKVILQLVDENKIVTYKSLSRHLNVYTHEAKQLLENFFKAYQQEYGLSAHYMVIGKQEICDLKSFKVVIVPETELKFQNLRFIDVTSSHIYCIHKGDLVDKNLLYSFDYVQNNTQDFNKLSSISNSRVIPSQHHKIIKPIPAVNGSTAAAPKPNGPAKKEPPKKATASSVKGKGVDIFTLIKTKSEAQKVNNKSASPNADQPSKNTKKEPNNKQGKNDVRSMFSKQAEKNLSKPKEKKEEVANHNKVSEGAKVDAKKEVEHSPPAEPLSSKSSKPTPKVGAKRKITPYNNNKRKKSKVHLISDEDSEFEAKKPSKKKHRRILTLDDSDSESETEETKDKAQRDFFESANNNDEMEDPSSDQPIPPTPPVPVGKRKRMKTVQKTYLDDEGFFVTKSVKEYVSCSDESDKEEPNKSKPVSKLPETKKMLANKKQSSLMSFFKQK